MDREKNGEIKINKKMRLWNKYRRYIIGLGGVLVILLLISLLSKGCNKSNAGEEKTQTTVAASENSTEATAAGNTESQAATSQTPAETQAATVAANKVYSTAKIVAKEDITSAAFYDNSVFLGDAIVNGIGYYKYLGADKIFGDTNTTTDKATSYIDAITAKAPQKVFIMLGINDLNYGSKNTDAIAASYASLISAIKTKLPAAKIYVISVLPITKDYEAKSGVYIRKANLEALNNKLKGMVTTSGFDYLDLTTAFQDSTGYLNTAVTGNGLNLTSTYYGFLLNTIADMLK